MAKRGVRWSDFAFVLARSVHDFLGFEASCRFRPTCSQYGRDAVAKFGPVKGSWMALRRVARCRPGASWGWDPVEESTRSKAG